MTLKRWIAAGCAVAMLLLLTLAWAVQSAVSRNEAARARWSDKVSQIRVLTKEGKVIPSTELLKNLQRQQSDFGSKLNIILGRLKKREVVPMYASPLAFKGDLFKIQRALLARAQALSIRIPADIGFKDFTGKEIPPAAELKNLAFQLAKIKEFLELLLDCPVGEIRDIQRGASGQQRIGSGPKAGEEEPFYRDFTFQAHFFCSTGVFPKFLSALPQAGAVFVLENLDVRLRPQAVLEVQVTVRTVSL